MFDTIKKALNGKTYNTVQENMPRKTIVPEDVEKVAWCELEKLYGENPKLFEKYNKINGKVRIVLGASDYSCLFFSVENGIVMGFGDRYNTVDINRTSDVQSLNFGVNIIKFVSQFMTQYRNIVDDIIYEEKIDKANKMWYDCTKYTHEMNYYTEKLGERPTLSLLLKSVENEKNVEIEKWVFGGAKESNGGFWADNDIDDSIKYDWDIVFKKV